MSEERFDRLETKVDGLGTKVDGLGTKFDSLDARLDGVAADVAVLKTEVAGLKTDVRGLAERQIDMEERLTTKMMVLHESTRDSIRLIAEAQHETTRQVSGLTKTVGAISTQMTQFADANRHFADTERFLTRILDNHEHRITALEKPQASR